MLKIIAGLITAYCKIAYKIPKGKQSGLQFLKHLHLTLKVLTI